MVSKLGSLGYARVFRHPRTGELVDNESGRTLVLGAGSEGRVRLGDLEYRVEGQVIDLGLWARQPLLWMGNPQLINFSPCRTGWDTELGPCSEQVYLPVLVPHLDNRLWFVRYTPVTRLMRNRFGIAEPEIVHRQRIRTQSLDLVLTPLVGFDGHGLHWCRVLRPFAPLGYDFSHDT